MRPPPWKRCAPAHAFLASLAEPEQDRMTDALAAASDREGTLLHLLSNLLPEGRKVILRGIQSRPELNGREAAVSATLSEGRVGVQLEHGENIRLRPNCLLPAGAASPASEWDARHIIPRWTLETDGMRKIGYCLTVPAGVSHSVAFRRLNAGVHYVACDVTIGETDLGDTEFAGKDICILRDRMPKTRGSYLPGLESLLVPAGECYLTRADVDHFKLQFTDSEDCKYEWPDHRAVLQCPLCCSQARWDSGKVHMMCWQTLAQITPNGFSFNTFPRLMCDLCFDGVAGTTPITEARYSAYLFEEPQDAIPMADCRGLTLREALRSRLGMGATEPMEAYDLLRLWSETATYAALTKDMGTQFMSLMGMKPSASRTSADRGRLTSRTADVGQMRERVSRRCAHPGCNVGGAAWKSLMACARCGVTFYCGPEHQRADWSRHKRGVKF